MAVIPTHWLDFSRIGLIFHAWSSSPVVWLNGLKFEEPAAAQLLQVQRIDWWNFFRHQFLSNRIGGAVSRSHMSPARSIAHSYFRVRAQSVEGLYHRAFSTKFANFFLVNLSELGIGLPFSSDTPCFSGFLIELRTLKKHNSKPT